MPVIGLSQFPYWGNVFGENHGQQCSLSIAYLGSTSTPVAPSAICTHILNDIVTPMSDLQSDRVHWSKIVIRRGLSATVYAELDIDITGQVVTTDTDPEEGEIPAPDFLAFKVNRFRSSLDFRQGFWRPAGLTQLMYDGDELLTSPFNAWQTMLDDVELAATVTAVELNMIILRQRPTTNWPLVDPEDESTWMYTFVSSLAIDRDVTTQNSRKHGRGA